jgi:SAM-dependent methyltransferase
LQNPNDKNNNPEGYLDNEITLRRSKYLYEVISKHFTTDVKILELGSNVGRNLNYLYERGYKNLTGVEIAKMP